SASSPSGAPSGPPEGAPDGEDAEEGHRADRPLHDPGGDGPEPHGADHGDLGGASGARERGARGASEAARGGGELRELTPPPDTTRPRARGGHRGLRSEEHTSELQSRE